MNNNIYSNLIKIIENYNDIIYNYEIIRYSYQFAPLNENGFEKMLYSSFYKITNYDDNNYKSIKFIYIFEFLKDFYYLIIILLILNLLLKIIILI